MKVFLLNKNSDFNPQQQLPWNEKELTQDLGLEVLFNAMSLGDEFLFDVIRKVIFCGLKNEPDTIIYRQEILKDAIANASVITAIYNLTLEAIENRKNSWYGIFTKHPSSVLSGSVGLMEIYLDVLIQIRNITDEQADKFVSAGFTRFFDMIKTELNDEYFNAIDSHLKELKFRQGILISAELGKGNKGINYILRKLLYKKQSWWEWLFAKKQPGYVFNISPRDESGTRALSEFNDEGLNIVANVVGQSADHMLRFFNILRAELAFYKGCLNLHGQLKEMNPPISFPSTEFSGGRQELFEGLYDVCLALSMKHKIVANDLSADNKDLFIITGANQGGKSTFLRSVGVAQLMMQCGMFVGADSFCANICSSLFTHFKRKEDNTMNSGKFDEEMGRLNDMADFITSNSMLLFNESFAATNDREGSEIARQIVSALLEKRCKVFFVTHLYEFASGFYDKKKENVIFLRAEREADTRRTFKIIEGEPLQSSYGADLYNKIFGIA
jgi:DNA mismatch repair ATPase MutS